MIIKQKIIFRADGGSLIGMGHFMRTLALAEMLNGSFYCVYATQKPTEYQMAQIDKVCQSRIDLPADDSHFEIFLSLLKGNEIVVLDNYYFSTEYQKLIKSKGCKLVCVDDMHDKHYVADILINHSPVLSKSFSVERYTRLLLGFRYPLLRKMFFTNLPKIKNDSDFSHAFICFGGSDLKNITCKIVMALLKSVKIKKISVVVGNEFQNIEALERAALYNRSGIVLRWFKGVNANQMIAIMNEADFSIVPSSTILLEAISQNIPAITGYYVDNQKELSTALKDKYRNILVIGDLNKTQNFLQHIETLKSRIKARQGKKLILNDPRYLFLKAFNKINKT
jgi:UDP-2,4-diacetamido-2,4,6-trideoxy-beta-L-altropyranose hydrolase